MKKNYQINIAFINVYRTYLSQSNCPVTSKTVYQLLMNSMKLKLSSTNFNRNNANEL